MDAVSALRKKVADKDSDLSEEIANLLEKLYITEIQKQLDMGRYKAAKKTPTVLDATLLNEGLVSQLEPTKATDVWTQLQCIANFKSCIQQAAKEGETALEEFDKDDDMAMCFVCAASNLRSAVFGIEPLQSLYAAKGIAGNIIPAIATTNAICAGLQILQCFHILQAQLLLEEAGKSPTEDLRLKEGCSYINCLRNKTRNGLYLTASKLEDPRDACYVCRSAIIPLSLNVHEWTLERLLQKVVKGKLGFEAPTILINGDFVWEEGEGADEDEFKPNLQKVLSKLPCGGIQNGTVIELDDATQDLTIQVTVTHRAEWDEEEKKEEYPFIVGGAPPKAKAESATPKPPPVAAAAPITTTKPATSNDDAIVLVIDDDDDNGKHANEDMDTKPSAKRSAGDDAQQPPSKKMRMEEVETIEID